MFLANFEDAIHQTDRVASWGRYISNTDVYAMFCPKELKDEVLVQKEEHENRQSELCDQHYFSLFYGRECIR